MVGGYPDHTGPYPDCPATCLDLWVIDYIDTPMDTSCVCNRSTLMSVSYAAGSRRVLPGPAEGRWIVLTRTTGPAKFLRQSVARQHMPRQHGHVKLLPSF